MKVLGIETSCDETAVAVLKFEGLRGQVLAEAISSQSEVHEQYGGVVPELASREHLRNLPLLVDQVLKESNQTSKDLNLIAVTQGPGLKGCLLIGLGFAQGMALAENKALIGINHIEGHLLAPMLDNPDLQFPFLALVVSGGHTEIVKVNNLASYEVLARTGDDAAGEAFDKSAHLLGFEYPGGAKLAALADQIGKTRFKLPKVMREAEGFSLSGLKTAISQLIRANQISDPEIRGELAYAVQESIVSALIFKLERAIENTGITKVVVTGGVSRNQALRKAVSQIRRVKAYFPGDTHCMDNAAMIAYAAGMRMQSGLHNNNQLSVRARWPVEEIVNNG